MIDLSQVIREYTATRRGHQDQHAEVIPEAFRAGAAWGLRKGAEVCRDQMRLWPTLRNDAAKAQATDIEIICLASAGRIERGEYENSTSSVMENGRSGSESK